MYDVIQFSDSILLNICKNVCENMFKRDIWKIKGMILFLDTYFSTVADVTNEIIFIFGQKGILCMWEK